MTMEFWVGRIKNSNTRLYQKNSTGFITVDKDTEVLVFGKTKISIPGYGQVVRLQEVLWLTPIRGYVWKPGYTVKPHFVEKVGHNIQIPLAALAIAEIENENEATRRRFHEATTRRLEAARREAAAGRLEDARREVAAGREAAARIWEDARREEEAARIWEDARREEEAATKEEEAATKEEEAATKEEEDPPLPDGQWECKCCTFTNSAEDQVCEMCDHARFIPHNEWGNWLTVNSLNGAHAVEKELGMLEYEQFERFKMSDLIYTRWNNVERTVTLRYRHFEVKVGDNCHLRLHLSFIDKETEYPKWYHDFRNLRLESDDNCWCCPCTKCLTTNHGHNSVCKDCGTANPNIIPSTNLENWRTVTSINGVNAVESELGLNGIRVGDLFQCWTDFSVGDTEDQESMGAMTIRYGDKHATVLLRHILPDLHLKTVPKGTKYPQWHIDFMEKKIKEADEADTQFDPETQFKCLICCSNFNKDKNVRLECSHTDLCTNCVEEMSYRSSTPVGVFRYCRCPICRQLCSDKVDEVDDVGEADD